MFRGIHGEPVVLDSEPNDAVSTSIVQLREDNSDG